jgi:hypothetical protein
MRIEIRIPASPSSAVHRCSWSLHPRGLGLAAPNLDMDRIMNMNMTVVVKHPGMPRTGSCGALDVIYS